jgi:DNA-binding MarR family transcriptional regulator
MQLVAYAIKIHQFVIAFATISWENIQIATMPKPLPDPPGMHAWARFLATHATLVDRIEAALGAAGLPPLPWYDVLWELEKAESGKLRMHELAHAVVLSRSNLTRLIDRLEGAGLTTRERCPDDRRGAYAAITPKGREMRRKMWPVYRQQIDELFASHLSAKEAEALNAMLGTILIAARGKAKKAA